MFKNSTGDLFFWMLPATGLAVVGLAGCHPATHVREAPITAISLTLHPDPTGGAAALRYPVEVAPRYANSLAFRVAGLLVQRNVRLGDTVRRGDVVALLDDADAQRQAAASRAALDAAQHRLTFATEQLERDRGQRTLHLIADSQFEQTQDAYSAARAGRDQAMAQWAVARNTSRHHTLVVDHDGVITSENADTGQVVTAGQAIFGLAWSGAVDATLDVAAGDVAAMIPGRDAEVTLAALPGQRFSARVREIAPAAEPQSRTYRVKLTLAAPETVARLGMTGEAVLLPLGATPVVDPAPGAPVAGAAAPVSTFTIPASALFHRGSEPAVWVVRPADSTLELRPVTVRAYAERGVVVAGGLADGETLVVAGVHTVYAGERVQPVAPLFADGAVAAAAAGSP